MSEAGNSASAKAVVPQDAQLALGELIRWAESDDARERRLDMELEGETATLLLRQVLRRLPDRRVVCSASLQRAADAVPQEVLLKIFLGARGVRYLRRELSGIRMLIAADVPTPDVVGIWNITSDAQGAQGLLLHYLPDAKEIDDALLAQQPELTPRLYTRLAQLNARGFSHFDLHFGNVLLSGGRLWFIDGGGLVAGRGTPQGDPRPLRLKSSMEQFARLAAQHQQSLSLAGAQSRWRTYCAGRHWPEEADDARVLAKLQTVVGTARRKRLLDFQAKTRRECSAFADRRTVVGNALVDRRWLSVVSGEDTGELSLRSVLRWLDGLPALMESRDLAVPLKSGNTATVVRVKFGDQPLIVKRYNNKSLWHRLRRGVREDRGLCSWTFGHTLEFLGIPACRAVALLRTRWAGPTYLVMEALSGEPLHPEKLDADAEAAEPVAQALLSLLDDLAREGLVHNDTKASNFIWSREEQRLAVIDLDAMRMPASRRAMRNGHLRDRRRLLRNFAQTPQLQRRFRSLLGL